MPDLSVIILSYNTQQLLDNCLTSIYKQIKEISFEIIVLDNSSRDKSVQLVKNKYPKIKLIISDKNLGFAKGINLAAKSASGKCLLLLNSDAQLLDINVNKMYHHLSSDKKNGVEGGLMLNSDNSLQRSTGKFYTLLPALTMLIKGDKHELINPVNGIYKTDWVSGGFMMIKRDIFNQLAGFDENFFMYMEDMEFCYRVRKWGFNIYFFPEAKAAHFSQGSSNRTFAIVNIYKGLPYFFKKHRKLYEYLIIKMALIIKAISLIIYGTAIRNKYLTITYKKALSVI